MDIFLHIEYRIYIYIYLYRFEKMRSKYVFSAILLGSLILLIFSTGGAYTSQRSASLDVVQDLLVQ